LQDTRGDEHFIFAGGKPIRCRRAIYLRRDDAKDRVRASHFTPQGN